MEAQQRRRPASATREEPGNVSLARRDMPEHTRKVGEMVEIDELRGSKVLRDLNDRELAEVAKLGTAWKRPAGQRVIREGSEAVGLYLLQEGRVQVRMTSRDGHEVMIDELGPGDLFGWSSVLDQSGFKAAIWTVEDSTLVVFDGRKMRALFEANNHIGYRVVREIAEIVASRLERLRSRLADQPFSEEWLLQVRMSDEGDRESSKP